MGDIIRGAIGLYMAIIIAHAVMTWMPGTRGTPIEKLLKSLVEPVLDPIRRLLEPLQKGLGIDFSPLILLILLSVVQGFF